MIDKSRIPSGVALIGACGTEIGQVDGIEGDFIRVLMPGGEPAYLPLTALADQEGEKVSTVMNHMAARSLLQSEPEPGEGSGPFTSS
ncbi:hypothetical protein ACFOD4_02450 [Pseudoroseomonas globiformis]|uniref:DUF2171 domain-containing protein n=1 Tax=Teichococcus globiformis TaxID=2307229 RepID=A0ABV7FXA9_9PROT